jgi:hypothetical protein
VRAFIAGIISAGSLITAALDPSLTLTAKPDLSFAEARAPLPILRQGALSYRSRATNDARSSEACSVIDSDDAGKRRLRTHDVDGVGPAAEKSDSGQHEAGLTDPCDIEVELVSRSRDGVGGEFQAR